jgi:dolichol-phosphate mannosyltransferase
LTLLPPLPHLAPSSLRAALSARELHRNCNQRLPTLRSTGARRRRRIKCTIAAIATAAGARVIRDPGLGKGAALRLAVRHVTTPLCVFVDADGSHDPIDIPLLVAPLHEGKAHHVQGSRLQGGSDELHGGWDEFFRLAGSALITCLINVRFGTRLSDSQNGFRAIRTEAFRSLHLRSRHTTIEMELIMASLSAGHTLLEVPTHERARTAGFSKISLANPLTWLSYGSALLRGLCRPRPSQPLTPPEATL